MAPITDPIATALNYQLANIGELHQRIEEWHQRLEASAARIASQARLIALRNEFIDLQAAYMANLERSNAETNDALRAILTLQEERDAMLRRLNAIHDGEIGELRERLAWTRSHLGALAATLGRLYVDSERANEGLRDELQAVSEQLREREETALVLAKWVVILMMLAGALLIVILWLLCR